MSCPCTKLAETKNIAYSKTWAPNIGNTEDEIFFNEIFTKPAVGNLQLTCSKIYRIFGVAVHSDGFWSG